MNDKKELITQGIIALLSIGVYYWYCLPKGDMVSTRVWEVITIGNFLIFAYLAYKIVKKKRKSKVCIASRKYMRRFQRIA